MKHTRNSLLLKRKFFSYLLPTLLVMVSISLATIIDSILVGNLLGPAALAAIGMGMPLISLLNATFTFFASGGVTLAAASKGARNHQHANQLFTMTIAGGVVSMTILMLLLYVLLPSVIPLLVQDHFELKTMTLAYLQPILLVGPFLIAVMGIASFIRIDGRPGYMAAIAIIANVVNLVLDYIFIGFLGMDISGAAWSTVVGYALALFALIPYGRATWRTFHFCPLKMSDLALLRNILATGSPKACSQIYSFVSMLVLNFLLLQGLGSAAIAAMTICRNVLMLMGVIISGITETMLPIVSALFGEKDYRGIRFTVQNAFSLLVFSSCIAALLFFLFPLQVAGLFGVHSPEEIDTIAWALKLYALSLPFLAINRLLQIFYQTTKRIPLANGIGIMNGFLFLCLFAIILFGYAVQWIWLAFVLAEMTTLAVILCTGVVIRRKDRKSKGVLLLSDDDSKPVWDFSVEASRHSAVELSSEIIRYCTECGIEQRRANSLGIAVEEIICNISESAQKKKNSNIRPTIDVILRKTEAALLISVRDDGPPFNPVVTKKEDAAMSGIELVKKLALHFECTQTLGFNNTLIKVAIEDLEEKRQETL